MNKRLLWTVLNVSTYNDTLSGLLSRITAIGLDPDKTEFRLEDDYDGPRIVLAASRPETDDECSERTKKETDDAQKAKAIRKAQYDRLKAEFETESDS